MLGRTPGKASRLLHMEHAALAWIAGAEEEIDTGIVSITLPGRGS